MLGSHRTFRNVLTTFTSVLLVAGMAGTAGAATDVSVTADAQKATYTDSTNMGKAVYDVEVSNLTGVTQTVETTVTADYPEGVSITGVTASATDASGNELTTTAGEPTGTSFTIDTADMPTDQTITYQVTVGYTYDTAPTSLTCEDDGGLSIAIAAGDDATASACVDAPAPAKSAGQSDESDAGSSSDSATSDSATSESATSESGTSESATSGSAGSESSADESSSDAPDSNESSEDADQPAPAPQPAPQQKSQPQAAPQQNSAAADTGNPVGDFGTWANDGQIYFSGWAYDASNMGAAPTTMWTIDGAVVGYQVAQLASPDLYPYGVFNRGVFGAFTAPSAGTHSICMFVFNIGAGADQLVRCNNVSVAGGDPAGDIWAAVRGDGSILVHGYAYDVSNTAAATPVWITDNGKIVGQFYANAANPSLAAYGVFGNHGIDFNFAPVAAGTHNLCLYVHNIGWGTGQWAKCTTVTIDVNPARDNPSGDFAVTANSGWVSVSGWAYDPNQPYLPVTTMWTVDGKVVSYASANQPHSGVNNYLGVPGNHGFTTNVPAGQGWHTVCMFVSNIGLGESVVTRCVNVEVIAPPNPCPAYAKACVDLTNNTTWLQSNGQIYAGPYKQIAGRAGYRTPTGSYKVFWKHIDHVSSIYNAPMPYAIFFNGGVAFHVGSLSVPSHGCIHLSLSVAQLYWNNLSVGDTVYVFGAAQY